MSFETAIIFGILQWIGLHMFVSIIGATFRDRLNKVKKSDKPSTILGTFVYVLILLVCYLYVIWYFVNLYWSWA